MEHINLEVPDMEVARLFFNEGLGLTMDPDTTGPERGGLGVIWYNIGRQQLHICKGPEAQKLPPGAAIGLTLPNVERIAAQLENVQGILGEVDVAHLGAGSLEVRDPWGNAYVITEPPADDPRPPSLQAGISYVLLPCHPGDAGRIGGFYEEVLGARVERSEGCAEVVVGAGCRLVFKEARSLGESSEQSVAALHTGWHAAVYIADFSEVYRKCEALGLINNDHPFRDKCYGVDDALRNRQFRIRDIVEVATGPGGSGLVRSGLSYVLDHEIRSLHHPRFLRPLYNRHAA